MTRRDERDRVRKLGRAVRDARVAAGLSQLDLADAADMKQPEISKLESGKRGLSPFQLARIAARLGVPVAALLASMDAPPAKGRRPVVRGLAARAVEKDPKPHV